jgi:hypothetical protein
VIWVRFVFRTAAQQLELSGRIAAPTTKSYAIRKHRPSQKAQAQPTQQHAAPRQVHIRRHYGVTTIIDNYYSSDSTFITPLQESSDVDESRGVEAPGVFTGS